jgi:hypothetical protein
MLYAIAHKKNIHICKFSIIPKHLKGSILSEERFSKRLPQVTMQETFFDFLVILTFA